jgi:phage tail sheath protein FI
MGFQVSPGVQVKEIDLTNVIPAVSTSIGAIAGTFQWGPVEEIVTVGSEKALVSTFGEPDADTFNYFMPAASFLKYGQSLRVVRAETGNLNSSSDGTGFLIKNDDHYDSLTIASAKKWLARFPGVLGNSLAVAIVGANSTAWGAWNASWKTEFDSIPGTSDFATSVGGSDDEMHIVVYDEGGAWSGQTDTILETFAFVSQASDGKASDGTNNYYVDVINNSSQYIRFGNHENDLASSNVGKAAAGVTFTFPNALADRPLSGGTDDNTPTVGEIKLAYDMFADAETVDVNLIIGGPTPDGADGVTHGNSMIAIAHARKDCVAFVSPPIADTVNVVSTTATTNVIGWADDLTSSSYGVIDSGAMYVYDKYNDVYRWIAASGAMAGLCAYTDDVTDPWWSPAGFNRGQLLGVTKLAYNPLKDQRDDLYKRRINPICTFPGQGTILFGDKTAQAKPSAFDRINVRRLFIVLEKAIATAAKYMLFEFNDEFTRAQFRNMVEPFLRDVKGRRGIYDFAVICDETNNTGQVIDTNRFVADIYIKPARSINFMTLNFIATRTGVEFSEIIGKF